VRGYNKSYNYFAGMSDSDVMSWQRRSVTGHRPTWPLGARAPHTGRQQDAAVGGGQAGERIRDPFDLFGDGADRNNRGRPQRPVRGTDLTQLHSLGLDETATPDQVKAQYKTLVKRLHPDANGGSRANEDKLREIIQAYGRLRETGFC
jgi:DnaJ-class molecular chaperone